ncbi:MAG: adenine deaminase C-terminal domain-containing protein, partial [Anaerolineales bacterium]
DILLTESLNPIRPSKVFVKGKLVAVNGELIESPRKASYPAWLKNTIHIKRGAQASDFTLRASGKTARVHLISLYPDQIINRADEAVLPIYEGVVQSDTQNDILKLAVVERYGKNGNIGITFVKGFGLSHGALASSVSHDHHNIVVVGTNDADMALCVKEIAQMQGGLVAAADGKVLATLALPIGGLLSQKPAAEVIQSLENLNQVAHQLGCSLPAPFMTLSFISLPTVPELGLTDYGLIDVRKQALINTIIETISDE